MATSSEDDTTGRASGPYYSPATDILWDTWIHVHEGVYYLYYLSAGIALATSRDGIRWVEHGPILTPEPGGKGLGSGALWPLLDDSAGTQRFILSFAELGEIGDGRSSSMFFAVSEDLVNWTRLGREDEFAHSGEGYRLGRWDNLWAIPRPGGGYLGYWNAARIDDKPGLGFGQSEDGLRWEALDPVELVGVHTVPHGEPYQRSPEVAAAHAHGGRYYVVLGLDDLDLETFLTPDLLDFRPGMTTLVADRPEGPFLPSPKNRRLLVTNDSYFVRFIDTPDGVLVNHHSWETKPGATFGVDFDSCSLAPLKRADWDDDGTLRLTWWEGNDAAKTTPAPLAAELAETGFDADATLLLEGVLELGPGPVGLFLSGDGDRGTAFLVQESGAVDYGDANPDGTGFDRVGTADREIDVEREVRFRLIRHGRITEFYVDDYLMQCYCLPERGTGRIGIVGSASRFRDLRAWYLS